MKKLATAMILNAILAFASTQFFPLAARAQGSLGEEQAAEKVELENMKQEMRDINITTDEAISALNKIDTQAAKKQPREIHLFCKEALCEVAPGVKINCLTYNGHIPGPQIVAQEGELLRIILHNQSKVPTSLHFHGMCLPQGIDGLPRTEAGLVKPGESYAFQFVAQPKGTYFYHPQIIHAEQKARGLSGAFIVVPVEGSKTYDRDVTIVMGDLLTKSKAGAGAPDSPKILSAIAPTNRQGDASDTTTYYLMNGQSAPAAPAIEVNEGERVRLRLINAGQSEVPLHLSGHRFDIVSINGDLVQNQTPRDTISLEVGDRIDIEFTANNPGVWSLASEKVEQTTTNGKFPGGIACVVRYVPK